MFTRALEAGALELPRDVAQTLVAELWRRAARSDEALAACDAAEHELAGDAREDSEDSPTATVIEFVRSLTLGADSEAHNSAEAFGR
jgi:hypothetical protein